MTSDKPRYAALDVFRGLTIFLMILVNTPGPGAHPWPFLVHADWFGFTGADFVFPSFLFAMGSALVFVLARPMSHGEFLARSFKRAGLLFLIGFLMFWYPFVKVTPDNHFALFPFADTRFLGVLQRLAVCYALAAVAVRFLKPKQIVVLCIGILVLYWALMVFCAAPGMAFDKVNNFGSVVDRLLIPQSHLYRWDDGFEPEGLLGNLPATVNVLAGYLACRYIVSAPATIGRVQVVAFGGVALAITGLFVSAFVPLSKKLWTDSFVLVTVGLDLVLLALLVAALDVMRLPVRTGFFEILGKNPLAVYLLSEMLMLTQALAKPFTGVEPYRWIGVEVFQRLAPGPAGSFLCALVYTLACWLFGYLLYRKRVFVRL
jgi:alpha-N-acetylglucosaminidase